MEVECSSTVNDLGYSGAVLFVQLMNRRYENASTVLTSNKGFEERRSAWGRCQWLQR
jgi:DNA replication protein DnaC